MNNPILSSPESIEFVYDLRGDTRMLSQIRESSLAANDFGPSMRDGIVGTDVWWLALKRGDIRLLDCAGTIRSLDGGPMGDSAIVRIDCGSETKSWAAWEGFSEKIVGNCVVVVYVELPPKIPMFNGDTISMIVQVRLVAGC